MPETSSSSPEGLRGASSLRRGFRLGFPILLGYLPVGVAFGIVAKAAGFTVAQAVVCSILALAGAGQFIGVSLFSASASLPAILATNVIVNLRYLLFGATIAPHLAGVPLWRQALLSHTLTDETFAVNIVDLRTGEGSPESMTGVGLIAWGAWTVATFVGAMATSAIGDPSAWGIDYAMPAMFTALLVGQIEDVRHGATAVIAVVLALLFAALVPGSWSMVAASIVAATVAAVAFR